MARVHLTSSLGQFTSGELVLELEVSDIKRLFDALIARHPGLKPHLEAGVAVAIDGQIYQDELFAPIGPNSEVHILPMISGG